MPTYRVIIVDDQTDIRRMLRAGVETLGPDLSVMDMPSAEEALLEISRQPIDLLISDIRLPGITGLELVAKARRRNPGLKIILITALNDSRTRRQAADSGADGFYNKPLDMPDFLDGVERALGIVHTLLPPAPFIVEEAPVPAVPLSDRLANLRQDLDALAVFLLDDQGHVLAQAGDAPEISALIPALLTSLSASSKVSFALDGKPPRNLLLVSSPQFNLCLAHSGPLHALLTVTGPQDERFPAAVAGAVTSAVQDLITSLEAVQAGSENGMHTPIEDGGMPEDEKDGQQVSQEEDLSQVEEIFQKPLKRKFATKDLNNFWETAVRQSDPNDIGNAGAISYDQAKKLGLAPKDKI